MAGTADIVSLLRNGVQAINALNQAVRSVFPGSTATAATATAGSATLPAQPAGFLVVSLPGGAEAKVPYYNS